MKIDFYILNEGDIKTRFPFTCRLVEKAYKNQHRLYIHTESEVEAHEIDELLWTYREDSFLPHNLVGEGPDSPPPIQIGYGTSIPSHHRDILINLSVRVPEFVKQFSRVLEIVPNDSACQEQARERFRFYRAGGFQIQTHKLKSLEI